MPGKGNENAPDRPGRPDDVPPGPPSDRPGPKDPPIPPGHRPVGAA